MTGVDDVPHRRRCETNVAVIASVSEATQGAGLIFAQGLPKPLGCFVATLLAMTGEWAWCCALAMTGVDDAPHGRRCELPIAVIASASEAT